jgi:hypothetical protein
MRALRAGPGTARRASDPAPRLALAIAIAAFAPPASAQPSLPAPLRLDFSPAPTCPDAAVLHNLVAASFGGHDPFVPDAPERLAVVVRRISPAHFVADLTLHDAAGSATLRTREEASSCVSLIDRKSVV